MIPIHLRAADRQTCIVWLLIWKDGILPSHFPETQFTLKLLSNWHVANCVRKTVQNYESAYFLYSKIEVNKWDWPININKSSKYIKCILN